MYIDIRLLIYIYVHIYIYIYIFIYLYEYSTLYPRSCSVNKLSCDPVPHLFHASQSVAAP